MGGRLDVDASAVTEAVEVNARVAPRALDIRVRIGADIASVFWHYTNETAKEGVAKR